MTPDLRVSVPAASNSRRHRTGPRGMVAFPQRTLDGVRIDMPGGWALVRSSVTEPALTFRFEGLDWHALDDLVERFCDTLPESRRRVVDALPGGHRQRRVVMLQFTCPRCLASLKTPLALAGTRHPLPPLPVGLSPPRQTPVAGRAGSIPTAQDAGPSPAAANRSTSRCPARCVIRGCTAPSNRSARR